MLIREDCTVDEFIDVILGNRKYIRCLYCYNKIDQISLEEVNSLAREVLSYIFTGVYLKDSPILSWFRASGI